jgi:serine phosphatase RsbU (regulator of sigma subunit)
MPRPQSSEPQEPGSTAVAPRKSRSRLGLLLLFLLLPVVGFSAAVGLLVGPGAMRLTAAVLLLGALLVVLVWGFTRFLRWFLWRVGRRLAFSYFLIGVLPIPMIGLLAALNGYLLSGYFLGHLYRDAGDQLRSEMSRAAVTEMKRPGEGTRGGRSSGRFVFARYRQGERIGGDDRLPPRWPEWLDEARDDDSFVGYVALADGTPTMISTAGGPDRGVLALFDGNLSEELSQRSDVWIELYRSDDPQIDSVIRLNILGQDFALLPVNAKRTGGRAEFFGIQEGAAADQEPDFFQRPLLWWGELAGSLRALDGGAQVSDYVLATMNGTLTIVTTHLFSGSAEVDTAIWAAAISATVILGAVYALAVIMSLYIIFTLTRAVNRLSSATEAVRRGNFSVRIPVQRRDQIGELQRSFNQMSANLETLVASEAQKEVLEKELRIARDLQQSLLPADLPHNSYLEFSTLFQPSAAIGGDYFDILRIDDHRLAVIIADVSGHGLPTGLRMVMIKAALVILVEEAKAPHEILRRLDAMVRDEQRIFVTATIGIVDVRTGELELTNAGHPPTYLIRDGEVEEILLPGNPLGTLGETYGHKLVELHSGDHVVWLSDGLIEATNGAGEPFGYERVRESLAGDFPDADSLRHRLVGAVAEHTGGHPIDDDQTLVVMRFKAGAEESDPDPTPDQTATET